MNHRAEYTISDQPLKRFIAESNRIEGIHREATQSEVTAHEEFLAAKTISITSLERFVWTIAGAPLRRKQGMDVHVGSHYPPPGGPGVKVELRVFLNNLKYSLDKGLSHTPFDVHRRYETLHPFMDGNGRSGRAIWAWHRIQLGRDPLALGFLHSYYYESLEAAQRPR